MIRVQVSESDSLLHELFETSAWNEAARRTSAYVSERRASLFNGNLPDAEIVQRVREIVAIKRAFENLYLSSHETMPADFRKVFE